jgi:hypothetical protein
MRIFSLSGARLSRPNVSNSMTIAVFVSFFDLVSVDAYQTVVVNSSINSEIVRDWSSIELIDWRTGSDYRNLFVDWIESMSMSPKWIEAYSGTDWWTLLFFFVVFSCESACTDSIRRR